MSKRFRDYQAHNVLKEQKIMQDNTKDIMYGRVINNNKHTVRSSFMSRKDRVIKWVNNNAIFFILLLIILSEGIVSFIVRLFNM